MTGMSLDLSADVVALTETIVDIESVSQNEAELADAIEAALDGRRAPRGDAHRPLAGGPDEPRPRGTRRDRRTHRHGAAQPQPPGAQRRRQAARAGHLRHEGRRGGGAPTGAVGRRAEPRRDLRLLRGRGDRRRPQRARHHRQAAARPGRGRLRDPDGAQRRGRRGRLPGHAAGRGHRPRRARPLRALPGAGATRSTRRARSSAAWGSTTHASRSSTGWSTTRASTPC